MRKLNMHIVLMTAFGLIGAVAASASTTNTAKPASTASDDLYSESIYIHKSSAEVPGALDSNARPLADRAAKAGSGANKPMESIEDVDTSAPTKKITRRSNGSRSSN